MRKFIIIFSLLSVFWLLYAIINPSLLLPVEKKKLKIDNPTSIIIGSNKRLWSFSHNGVRYRVLCALTKNNNGDYFCDFAFKKNIKVKSINIMYFDDFLFNRKTQELVIVENINFYNGVMDFNIPINQIAYWEGKLLLDRKWFFYCFFIASYVGLILYLIQYKIKSMFFKIKGKFK